MTLEVCILYPDLLNSYGDTGNLMILKHRIEKRGMQANIHYVSVGDEFTPEVYDIVLMGGAQYHEQEVAAKDLLESKGQALKEYVHDGGVALFICGAYQMIGEYYVDDNGDKIAGLGILPIVTKTGNKRMIGDIVTQAPDGTLYAGFENHLGATDIGDLEPFAKVLFGYGNDDTGTYEGCRFKNSISSYLHGPILAKNPELADELIEKALVRKAFSGTLEVLDDTLEQAAKKSILRKLNL